MIKKTNKTLKEKISPILTKPFPIPDFSCTDAHGKNFTHKDLEGQWHILYFYPKDMTSGCTIEAREFETVQKKFTDLNCRIIGVSKDSCASHIKFQQKENLSFILLSDKESDLCEKFGVWQEKSMYGKKYMGIERTTFIINPEGKVVAKFSKVKVNGHVNEVFTLLRALCSMV